MEKTQTGKLNADTFFAAWRNASVPFFEDEEANGVYGFGHVDRERFAKMVNDYDRDAEYPGKYVEDSAYTVEDVLHDYARVVFTVYADGNERDNHWILEFVESPAAAGVVVPVTWISR